MAKTIQKRTSELREKLRPAVARPAAVPDVVPEGQFGPYGGFAPSTPPVQEAERARTPVEESVQPEPEEATLQGHKRDAEEAEVPEAPSR